VSTATNSWKKEDLKLQAPKKFIIDLESRSEAGYFWKIRTTQKVKILTVNSESASLAAVHGSTGVAFSRANRIATRSMALSATTAHNKHIIIITITTPTSIVVVVEVRTHLTRSVQRAHLLIVKGLTQANPPENLEVVCRTSVEKIQTKDFTIVFTSSAKTRQTRKVLIVSHFISPLTFIQKQRKYIGIMKWSSALCLLVSTVCQLSSSDNTFIVAFVPSTVSSSQRINSSKPALNSQQLNHESDSVSPNQNDIIQQQASLLVKKMLATAAMTATVWAGPTMLADQAWTMEQQLTQQSTLMERLAIQSNVANAREMASGTGSRVNKDPESLLRLGLPIQNKEVSYSPDAFFASQVC
jgi:hypothetical protein